MATTRLSGLISGMDTESIISQLVEAKQTKVDDETKAQTKLSWKQDAWKELNTKIKNLQSKYISNMRFSSSFAKKTTSVSNSSAVSVITGENAVDGVQELEINQLAKTGYLTGAKLSSSGTTYTALSTLKDLGFDGEGSLSLTNGGKTTEISVTGDTTISSLLTQLKNAGLNASFDEKQQRLFISSKKSGSENDFSLTGVGSDGIDALSKLGLMTNLSAQASLSEDKQSAEYKAYSAAAAYVGADDDETLANLKADGTYASALEDAKNSYLDQYKTLIKANEAQQKIIDEITAKYTEEPLDTVDSYTEQITSKQAAIDELKASMESMSDEDKATAQTTLDSLNSDLEKLKTLKTDAQKVADANQKIADNNTEIDNISGADGYITVTTSTDDDGNTVYSAEATEKLEDEVADSEVDRVNAAKDAISATTGNYATKVSGQDALITLNGAEFTSTDNVFEINGLTYTALSETKEGESITVTTKQDTDGIYDMIRNFFKEYNTLINEMDSLYNADSADGYEPLTDDEKDAMTDTEIEEYEEKIKSALLRRDDNLNTISELLKTTLLSGIDVDGKTYHLSDFGINTLGYFTAADNEKNAYHIDGDENDDDTSGNTDKLKSMIASDPDTVIKYFTELSKTLYTKMSNVSKSVSGYRSYGSFYDDKKMESDYDDYTDKIEEEQEKVNDYEDKWYDKFSSMETALAKLQSNSSAVTSMLGGS